MLEESEIKRLLQKLAANEATEKEKSLLDAAADHDEFLKEVLDGYRSAKSDQSIHLVELHERIEDRVTERKKRTMLPYHWKSIAAAVILFLAVGIWMVVGSLQNSQDQVVMELDMKKEVPAPPSNDSEAPPSIAQSSERLSKNAEIALESNEVVSAPNANRGKANPSESAAQPQASVDQTPTQRDPNYDRVIYLTEGQVFGRGDKPLGGAKVTLVDHGITTYSDLQGRFLLPLKKVNGKITILHPDYAPKTMSTVSSMDISSFSLSPIPTKSSSAKSTVGQNDNPATPVPGWRGLARYLGQNLRFPPEAVEQNIYASVELNFTVDEGGQPQDVKVKNPVGFGFDEEAIRLISEGPKWNPARNPNEVIYYIVNF